MMSYDKTGGEFPFSKNELCILSYLASERISEIPLAPIVLGWALGVKGERIDDKEETNECERDLCRLRKSVFSRKVCVLVPGV